MSLSAIAPRAVLSCTFAVSAFAAQITVNPNGYLNFSSTKLGRQSAPQVVTATNVGGTAVPLSISISEPYGPGYESWPQFMQTNDCGNSLPAGASCSIRVNYTPTHQGNMTAGLVLGPSNPTVTLTGQAEATDNSNIFITTDAPAAGSVVSGKITAYGWALANHEGIANVTYSIDEPQSVSLNAGYGASRGDVCQAHPGVWGCPDNGPWDVGWAFGLDTTTMTNGPHTLHLKATGLSSNVSRVVSIPFTVANRISATTPSIQVDAPSSGATLTGKVNLYGWVVGVSNMEVSVDGVRAAVNLFQPRADVCAVYTLQGCPRVGWSYILDTTRLPDGPHTLNFLNPTPARESNLTVSIPVTVANYGVSQSNPVRVTIDRPGPQAGTLSGTVAVDGWAIADDGVIDSVYVTVDGENPGTATYGGSRLDVCVVFPNRPGCPKVGWNFLLDTTRLADGPHRLVVTAHTHDGKNGTVESPIRVSNAGLNNSLRAAIDYPRPNSVVSGTVKVTGWALNDNGPVGFVTLFVDGIFRGVASDSILRADVCAVYPGRQNCPLAGWTYFFDSLLFPDGQHTLDVVVSDGARFATFSTTFRTDNSYAANPTLLYVDQPNAGTGTLSGWATVSGWAMDDREPLNGRLSFSVDGVPFNGPIAYDLPRPDVCAAYSERVGCGNVGWSYLLDTTAITDGAHTLTVKAPGTKAQTTSVKIKVANGNSAPASVKVYIDRPTSSSPSLQGVVAVSGWAFAIMGQQPSVNVYIDNVFAAVTTANSRPDLCVAFPAALGCPNVGWSVQLDTTQFTDGPHTLTVVADSGAFGTGLFSVPITIGNFTVPDPMHLTIDVSASNTLSGVANLFGWAVSDQAAIGTVAVAIDGAELKNVSYGDSRNDVCAVYQNRLGCPNVGWHVPLNTTNLSNGSHTISVTATDAFGAQTTQTATVTVKN